MLLELTVLRWRITGGCHYLIMCVRWCHKSENSVILRLIRNWKLKTFVLVELAQLPSAFTPLHNLHKVGTFSKFDKNVTVPT